MRLVQQILACAARSRPPVEPPKMGEGVSAFRVGCTHLAGAAFVASSARTTTERRCEGRSGAQRRVVRAAAVCWLEAMRRAMAA